MNLAKISANGQITLPSEIRKILEVKAGDKILFIPQNDGSVLISNAASAFNGVRDDRVAYKNMEKAENNGINITIDTEKKQVLKKGQITEKEQLLKGGQILKKTEVLQQEQIL